MSKNKFTVNLSSSINLTPAKRNKLHEALLETVHTQLNAIQEGMVTVSVVFNKSLGNLRAHHAREGQIIASGIITSAGDGIIVLAESKRGDVIGVDGESQGTARVTINVDTDRQTPVEFGDGLFSERFDII